MAQSPPETPRATTWTRPLAFRPVGCVSLVSRLFASAGARQELRLFVRQGVNLILVENAVLIGVMLAERSAQHRCHLILSQLAVAILVSFQEHLDHRVGSHYAAESSRGGPASVGVAL